MIVATDGAFQFLTGATYGGSYSVTISQQPATQTCTVSRGSGIVSGDVTDISITCGDKLYTVGGTASGVKRSLVLANGSEQLTVSSDGSFTFPTSAISGSSYSVTVVTQPVGQSCTVTNGSGAISGANVTNVSVACTDVPYAIGGSI